MLKLFLILYLVHLLADFIFQPDWMVEDKQNEKGWKKHRALLLHTGTLFIISLLLLGIMEHLSLSLIVGLFLLCCTHYLLDWGRTLNKAFSQMKLFIADQFLYLILIILFVLIYQQKMTFIVPVLAQSIQNSWINEIGILEKFLITICLLILITAFTNIFIRTALSSIKMKIIHDYELVKIGRYIGCVERILTAMGVVAGAYEALVALYGTKAAIRFGQAREDPQFAEYFILGTSISALFGICLGLIFKVLVLN